MLVIRLKRVGKKNQPFYRVVLAEHARPVKGKFIKILGSYNPFNKKSQLKNEEILKWLGNGAKPSNSAAKILVQAGLKHPLIVVKTFKKKLKKKEVKAPEAAEVKETKSQEKTDEKKEESTPEEQNKPTETKTDTAKETAPTQ